MTMVTHFEIAVGLTEPALHAWRSCTADCMTLGPRLIKRPDDPGVAAVRIAVGELRNLLRSLEWSPKPPARENPAAVALGA